MQDCELCCAHHPNEIWRNSTFYVVDAKDSRIPGYVRVILCDHIAEMSDLTDEKRHFIMDVVNCIERLMRDTMKPKKINLAEFGTMVPHLHWHIIPRYEDDAFYPASTWSNPVRDTAPEILERRTQDAYLFFDALRHTLSKRFH